jgi:hypothetical protein
VPAYAGQEESIPIRKGFMMPKLDLLLMVKLK